MRSRIQDRVGNADSRHRRVKTAAKVRNADYAFFNIVLAVVVTGLLAFVAAVSGVFGGWPAVEMSIVIIYMAVFAVIIFLLIAIF